jgi:hypothetical protein
MNVTEVHVIPNVTMLELREHVLRAYLSVK